VVLNSTKEAVLKNNRHRHPLVELVLEYREAHKQASTYGTGYPDKYICPVTGRVHASYNQIGAVTGRMSAADPNLQQIPKEAGYRAAFRAPSGRKLLRADLAQVELVVAAEVSGDIRMQQALKDGEDLHAMTAAALFQVPVDQVTKAQRKFGKQMNFGTLYGQGVSGLLETATANGLQIDEAGAKQFQGRFDAAWPQLAGWRQRQMKDKSLVCRTMSGRMRRFAVGDETMGPAKANTPIQGGAADLFKVALARMWETRHLHPDIFPVNAVHDELVLEAPAAAAEEAKQWVVQCLQYGAAQFLTRLQVGVDVKAADDWAGEDEDGQVPIPGVTAA
jgi:DNA polymerase-1